MLIVILICRVVYLEDLSEKSSQAACLMGCGKGSGAVVGNAMSCFLFLMLNRRWRSDDQMGSEEVIRRCVSYGFVLCCFSARYCSSSVVLNVDFSFDVIIPAYVLIGCFPEKTTILSMSLCSVPSPRCRSICLIRKHHSMASSP